MKRRDFIRYGSAAVGSAAAGAGLFGLDPLGRGGFPYHLYAADQKKTAQDVITLGKTGITVSRLAQGTGTSGTNKASNQTRGLGDQGLANLLAMGVDNGLAFWDVADQYGTHPHVKLALKTVKRDRVAIMTKTHANTEAEMWSDLDRFRRETGAEQLDIVLLHCMLDSNWPTQKAGAMNVLAEAKQKGIIRAHGVSCHDLGAMKVAAESDWVDVDLARLNPVGAHMDGDPATIIAVLKRMKEKGKGVIGMKILGQGALRSRVDEALQFALAQECLDCFTIGAENPGELRDLMKRIPPASVRA
jgi:aryl-alcohol dehydrogenase-like predicted oxidoreductase